MFAAVGTVAQFDGRLCSGAACPVAASPQSVASATRLGLHDGPRGSSVMTVSDRGDSSRRNRAVPACALRHLRNVPNGPSAVCESVIQREANNRRQSGPDRHDATDDPALRLAVRRVEESGRISLSCNSNSWASALNSTTALYVHVAQDPVHESAVRVSGSIAADTLNDQSATGQPARSGHTGRGRVMRSIGSAANA